MFIFTEESIAPRRTPWGVEVGRKLLERNMKQVHLIGELKKRNINIQKSTLTMLLQGRGTSNHIETIHAINDILEIPEAKAS